jgi:molecular chaperone HtpG
VTVETRRAGLQSSEGVRWSCEGEADFQIENIERAERGTTITLHIKDDSSEFLSDWQLRSIIKKYSDHISIPVQMPKQDASTDDEEDEDGNIVVNIPEWEAVNNTQALWTRPKNEVSDEEYKKFYNHVSGDFSEPLVWSHNQVEGKQEYTSLLYIPSMAPFDLYQSEAARGIKLYVKRTFIMDDAEQFLPNYLRFAKGVLDSADLPLNISREILQKTPIVESIRASLAKRVLDMLSQLAKSQPEKYATFWSQFGVVLKEGPSEDYNNREKIAKLFRFASSKSKSSRSMVGLEDYIERMKEGQDKIYYMTGDNRSVITNSPYLEVFRKHDIEVLLMSDHIDEWVMSYLSEFDGKSFQDIARGNLDLSSIIGEDEKPEDEKPEEKDKTVDKKVLSRIKTLLGKKIDTVRSTNRLTNSPACLVIGEHEMGEQMRRIMRAAGQATPEASKPILEVNMEHPLVVKLSEEKDEKIAAYLARVLFDQAALSAGKQLENPVRFIQEINKLMFQ